MKAALASALCWLVGGVGLGCGVAPESPPEPFYAYHHLGDSFFDRRVVLSGGDLERDVWNLDGDVRPVLFQHPPSRVSLGPLPEGRDCRLRVALGLSPQAWDQSDGVVFHVELSGIAEVEPLWSEPLVPALLDGPQWLEREIPLPTTPAGETDLILETGVGPNGNRVFDHAGWASPHIVCQTDHPQQTRFERPHILLISIDTLRADHLGVYGYPRQTSPVIDALAREPGSTWFEHAFAPAPWTLPSHASMFTGLYPEEHGAGHATPKTPLADSATTIAESLRDAGYDTLGFSAGGIMSRRYGLDQGFDRWGEFTKANLAAVLPVVFDALGTQPQRPFFLFVHTYDVHGPYAEWIAPEQIAPVETRHQDPGEWERIRHIGYHRYQLLDRFQNLGQVLGAYDAGVRHVDTELGALFARLKEIGVYDRTAIIVTSDHGESLYDRKQYLGHTYTLYDEEIRVPLIVRLPDGAGGGRSDALVSLVDVMPLLLALAGLEPPAGLSGNDPLHPSAARTAVRGEAMHTGARYARSVGWKWISAADSLGGMDRGLLERLETGPMAFDLSEDAGELHNLASAGSVPADARALEAQLPLGTAATEVEPVPTVDGEEANRLRALGYLP